MAERIDIDGVDTWTETRGSGEHTLVLLHGGLGNSDDLLDSLGAADLVASFRVVAFDRRGHGYTADTDEPFHYDDMATHAIGVLEHLDAAPKPHLVGWSDGGIVAMLVALRRPDLVDRLVLIGTNFHFEGIHELDPGDGAPPALMLEAYAKRSPDGADHYPVVAEKFMAMATSEPTLTPGDLARLEHPTLVLVGDDDLVRLDHTVALYEALPAGRLCVVPGASHAVVLEQPRLVAAIITDFLQGPEPPQTLLPIRRSP
ncbi:pimeloyl-ACP methyl ester carboxylesterase [Agromyces ramosus]|uniref:Pimeloyl-ACP methyl ester carboxylesterase n=1 Tax=Agromyces ramosus TaxID=33879 RepID=A0A4Q7M9Z7_9MICO|nr:alpha/beta hydrolase [Agromyces ramosus]RZS64511.1 pimeloyl-ACP methyl ester carboxylesterase [Agromyces ramosus]